LSSFELNQTSFSWGMSRFIDKNVLMHVQLDEGYWHSQALQALGDAGISSPTNKSTDNERRLWLKLLKVQAASLALLDLIHDDAPLLEADHQYVVALHSAIHTTFSSETQ
jgi:hypothetical protein